MAYRLDLFANPNSVNPTERKVVEVTRNAAKARALRLAARTQAPVDVIDLLGRSDEERYVGTASPYMTIKGAYFSRLV